MGTAKVYRHSVLWGNPYTSPPSGMPRILVSEETTNHIPSEGFKRKQHAILDRLYAKGIWTYSPGWDLISREETKRGWSDEAKKRNRRKRLEKRLAKKYSIPQLFEAAVEKAIADNPSYFT